MNDDLFDQFALYQWETDGGPAFDDAFDGASLQRDQNCGTFAAAVVASRRPACLIQRGDHCIDSGDQEMTELAATDGRDIFVHAFHVEAQCEYSGKVGEAVEISTSDGTIQHAVICIAELTKLLRFRHRQQEKQNGNGKPVA